MKVLSLFDGISCCRVALERAGIPVELYYAAEIDKYAIQISHKNYPDIIQVGSVVGLDTTQFKDIDLMVGGSPCQDLSIAKKDRKGLDGVRSGLFWEYVRILKEVKPKYFVLENVNSMPKEAKALITETLGVEPIMINAALVSAQNRKRLFWFGQIRERLYFTEVFCYDCLYENSRIQKETLRKGESKVLGETQGGHNSLQGVSEAIPANNSQGDDKNLFVGMSDRKQETQRPKERQGKESNIPEKVYTETPSEVIGVSQEISSISNRKAENEGSGRTTSQENHKGNEDTLSSRDNGNKEENNARGGYGDTGNEKDMCCVRCSKRLDDRPYKSFVSGWDKQFEQPTNSLSEVQFNEARQNNGRVYDVYQMNVIQPEDRGIFLKDILEDRSNTSFDVYNDKFIEGNKAKTLGTNPQCRTAVAGQLVMKEKSNTIRTGGRGSGAGDKHDWESVYQYRRTYWRETKGGKVPTLTANMGTGGNNVPYVPVALRNRGEGKKPEYNGTGKANALTTVQTDSMVDMPPIRKLSPVECERLQSLPDGYTEGVSNTRRYQTLGNAFNCEVVAHILKHIKDDQNRH